MSKTYIAFDYGLNHIGVAVGQSITLSARPLAALKANQGVPQWPQVKSLIDQWQPSELVVGLPLNMDGTEQPITQRVKKFSRQLEGRFNLKVLLCDERLSTVDAKAQIFEEKGYRGLKNKGDIDAKSAAVILESWLAQHYE